MQIIEFNGLPGTGKTTIAKALKKQLDASGYTCLNSLASSSSLGLILTCVSHPSSLLLLIKLFRLYKVVHNKDANKKIVLLITHYYQCYLKARLVKSNYLIVDQGIIQGLISLAHTSRITTSPVLVSIATIITNNVRFWRVDCFSNQAVSFDRIRSREAAGSRLDNMNDKELRETFRTQTKNFFIVREVFSSIEPKRVIAVDTTRDVDYNVQYLIKKITL